LGDLRDEAARYSHTDSLLYKKVWVLITMDLLEIKAIGECQVSRFADVVLEDVSTYP
jgi:hypothetical protein